MGEIPMPNRTGTCVWVHMYGYMGMGTCVWVHVYGYMGMGTCVWVGFKTAEVIRLKQKLVYSKPIYVH